MMIRLCREDLEQLAILIGIATKKIATPRYAVELTALDPNNAVILTDVGLKDLTAIVNNHVICGSAGSITYSLVDGGEVTLKVPFGEIIYGHFRRIIATDIYPLVGHGSMSESSIRV